MQEMFKMAVAYISLPKDQNIFKYKIDFVNSTTPKFYN